MKFDRSFLQKAIQTKNETIPDFVKCPFGREYQSVIILICLISTVWLVVNIDDCHNELTGTWL